MAGNLTLQLEACDPWCTMEGLLEGMHVFGSVGLGIHAKVPLVLLVAEDLSNENPHVSA